MMQSVMTDCVSTCAVAALLAARDVMIEVYVKAARYEVSAQMNKTRKV